MPSKEYLQWYNQLLEQYIQEQGHSEQDLLAFLTNHLIQEQPTKDNDKDKDS